MLDLDRYEQLTRYLGEARKGTLPDHILLMGAGGIGKTEACKAGFPMTDEEAYEIDKIVKDTVHPLMLKIEFLEDMLKRGDEDLLEVYARLVGSNVREDDDDEAEASAPGQTKGTYGLPLLTDDDDAETIRENLERLLAELKAYEGSLLKELPTYQWYQGTITTKGVYEFAYYYRHAHFETLLFNDISIHGTGSIFWKQFLEKKGKRKISWVISSSAKNKGNVPQQYLISARCIFICNKFAPAEDEDWDAVLSRIMAIRFIPGVTEKVKYISGWCQDRPLVKVLQDDLAGNKIADLDIRKALQAGRLMALGMPESEWRQYLGDAYQPRSEDHLPEDSHAVLEYCRKRDLTRVRETEVYRQLNRFKAVPGDTTKERGRERLMTAFNVLVSMQWAVKLTPTGKQQYNDLYQILNATERAERIKQVKAMADVIAVQSAPAPKKKGK